MLKLENRFFRVELAEDASFLQITDIATGCALNSNAPLTLTYGNFYTWQLHSRQGKITVSQDAESLQIDFSEPVLWARYPENPFRKPITLDALHIVCRIKLAGEELYFEVDPIEGMDGEVFDVVFPNNLYKLPSTEAARAFIPYSYGMEYRFPVPPEQFMETANPENAIAIFGATRPDKAGFVFWLENWHDMQYSFAINGKTPGQFGARVVQHFTSLANYTHRQHFRFLAPGADIHDLANYYRSKMEYLGVAKTLREKIADSPAAEKLVGSVIWKHDVYSQKVSPKPHADSYWTLKPGRAQVEGKQANWSACELFDAAKAAGCDKICVLNMGWNHYGFDNGFPTRFPVNPERGTAEEFAASAAYGRNISENYIYSVHDNYIDCYPNSPEFDKAEMVTDANGGTHIGGVWVGGRCSYMCTLNSERYMHRDIPKIKELLDCDSIYIDVIARGGIKECYHPDHIQSRREDAETRRRMLKFVRKTIGSLVSEALSAPYCLDVVDLGAFAFPYRSEFAAHEPLPVPVPFWQLALHDCILNCTPEGFFPGTPGDYRAFMALYGLLPMALDARELDTSRQMRNTYLEKMTLFEILGDGGKMYRTADGSVTFSGVMRSTFADGVSVTANFSDTEFDGIAPHDFRIDHP